MGTKKPPTIFTDFGGKIVYYSPQRYNFAQRFQNMLTQNSRTSQSDTERKRLMFILSVESAVIGTANSVDVIFMDSGEALAIAEESDGRYELYLTMREARAAERYYRNNR